MGRPSDCPRYNVVSARLSDLEREWLDTVRGGRSKSEWIYAAIMERLAQEAGHVR